jgi:hypothetical protein
MPLKPLPPPQQPIAAGIPPTQPYAEYFQALDKTVRGILASPPNTQTVNYVLALQDADGVVETNQAGANTVTVPLNNAVPFQIGTRIQVRQMGAGATTLVAAVGVTIRNRLGLVSGGQYAVFYLDKRATDEWVASGDLT